MREVVIFSLHLIVTVVRLARPGGLRSVVAESLLVKDPSIAAAVVLPTCGPESVSSPVCAPLFHEPGTRVYQLVDQLRQDF